jgi:BirA family biotin operon repressor/biotin-[acetyl-CoA-carboxylase] ligase
MPAAMLWLCERPEPAGALVPYGSPAPAPCPAGSLDAPTAALWRALGGPGRPWSLSLARDTPARDFWSRVIVTSRAPSSRFDLLRGPLASHVSDLGPVACVALDGDGFHGHHGRRWSAAAGNLHLSAALPARLRAATLGAALSMLPAVAVCDAIATVTGGAVQPSIKWVNDIVVADGKLAGVLTTTRLLGGEIGHVVFGIGVNVAVAPAIEPTPFVPSTACLKRCPGGEPIGLGALLWAVLDALTARLAHLHVDGAAAVHQEYVRRSLVLGRHVRVWDDRATDGKGDPRLLPLRRADLAGVLDVTQT